MSWKDFLIGILVIGLLVSSIATISISSVVGEYRTDLEKTKEDLHDSEDTVNLYKGWLKNAEDTIDYLKEQIANFTCPECPECEDCDRNPIYDVNRDGIINFEDSSLIWDYIGSDMGYRESKFYGKYGNAWNLLYDVNCDGKVNNDDAQSVWNHCD